MTMATVSSLGNWLRDQRRRHGLEQVDIAERVGVKQQTVSRWENGEAIPRGRFLLPLANALEVSLDQLSERIVAEHNHGGVMAETLDMDMRLLELEREVAALRSEWAGVREAFRRLLGEG